MTVAMPGGDVDTLVQLRRDVGIAPAGFDMSGAPGLVLHDPLRHVFFRLPVRDGRVLDMVRRGTTRKLLQAMPDGAGLLGFLVANQLLVAQPGSFRQLSALQSAQAHGLFHMLVHNYLFFRIHLWAPEPFLDAALPFVSWLGTRRVLVALLVLAGFGGYFALRQWDVFLQQFNASLSLAGAASYGVALFVLKFFHELGHAFVARRWGARVPSIGVAFMVMAPMFYTEASDAWRLPEKWQRFAISAAGVCVELGVACLALFLWAFLPDGPARAICFFLATTALVASLFINLSPFMRFDGYHMLGDALGLHSLGPRSFALATWQLRRVLFASAEALPEVWTPLVHRLLVGFAWATWIYRFMLFSGIAWLLYTSLPKVAGLPLAAVEIYFFILRPVLREMGIWRNMAGEGAFSRQRMMLAGLLGLLVLGLAGVPLDRHVHAPAVLLPAQEARMFPPEAAQVLTVRAKPGMVVAAGDVLVRLFVPEIGHLQRMAQIRHDLAVGQLQRVAADAKDRAALAVLTRERDTAEAELAGLAARGRLLVLRAPFAGVVTGDGPRLVPGQWVGSADLMMTVTSPGTARIAALLPEREAGRVETGAAVQFVAADGLTPPLDGRLAAIGLPGGEGVIMPYLDQRYGGPVVLTQNQEAGGQPLLGHLPLHIETAAAAPARATVGTVMLKARPESLLGFLSARLVTVFLRESGF